PWRSPGWPRAARPWAGRWAAPTTAGRPSGPSRPRASGGGAGWGARTGRVAWGGRRASGRPAPERVAPGCPLFGRCGGCQWQHVPRAVQLEAKRRIVERALGAPVAEVRAVGPDYGYRDRARLVVGDGP